MAPPDDRSHVRPEAPEPGVRADPRRDPRCARRRRDDRAACRCRRRVTGGVDQGHGRASSAARCVRPPSVSRTTAVRDALEPALPELHDDRDGRPRAPRHASSTGISGASGSGSPSTATRRTRLISSSASRRTMQARHVASASRRVHAASFVDMLIFFLVRDDLNDDGWQSGFMTADGTKKPAHAAFRFSLDRTSRRGGVVSLWGQVKPRAGAQPYRLRILQGGRWSWLGGTRSTNRHGRALREGPSRSRIGRAALVRARSRSEPEPSRLSAPRRSVATPPAARLGSPADGPSRGTGRHPALRRNRRARRRVVRRRGRAHLGAHRAERRRQDDGIQRHHAALQARLGRGAAGRLLDPPGAGVQDRGKGDRAHVPESPALPHDVRARERARRRARPRAEGR